MAEVRALCVLLLAICLRAAIGLTATVQRSGGAGERVAATERAPACQDVREHRGQRSLRRRRRHEQELLLRGRPQQTTHAQSLHPSTEVDDDNDNDNTRKYVSDDVRRRRQNRRNATTPLID